MARGSGKPAFTFDEGGGEAGSPVLGPSIDPATLGGGGAGGGGADPSGDDGFDPAIHVSRDKRNGDGSFTRKRGRKSGSSGGAKSPKTPPDLKTQIDALSRTLVIVHAGIASATNTEELVLDKDEAETLAAASANVMQHFDLAPDPKTQAIIGFIMAAGSIYGPRVYLIRARKAQEAKERGSGVAGVYGPGGEPLGTTEFTAPPQ